MDIYTELYHHGIKGQRWGTRKYQNSDGSLTPLGRIRYGAGEDRRQAFREYGSQLKNQAVKGAKFGVALAKAKGEHYSKTAYDQYSHARNKAVNTYRHAFKSDYYYKQNKQNTWDYIYKKGANRSRITASKITAEKAKDYIRLCSDTLLDSAKVSSEIDSIGRYNKRSNMAPNSIPKDISSLSLSELRAYSGSSYKSISEAGATYTRLQSNLNSVKWQDYFTPATTESYNPYYGAAKWQRSYY